MMSKMLSLRQLNRATLQRQLLLERHDMNVVETTERLMGIQAQVNNPPYIGLWTRLNAFDKETLSQAMRDRQIVRAPLLRSTLHLFSADDYMRFRSTIQPALTKGYNSFFGTRQANIPLQQVLETAEKAMKTQVLTTSKLKELLFTIAPNADSDALAYATRTFLALVQVPPSGFWGTGVNYEYTLAEDYLGKPMLPEDLLGLFKRYLRAFGPASIKDFQFWVGITKLQDMLKGIKDQFTVYKDEKGTELFDLPDLQIPEGDTPAPIRFMPEYDNLVIGHDSRVRVLADEHYKRVFLSAARVRSMILVDGFVAGAWKIDKTKGQIVLSIEPFVMLDNSTQETLEVEGQRLMKFVEPNGKSYSVIFDV
jgi:hypothetical protein